MDFAYSDEQRMLVDTVRAFVAKELMPHEAEVERDNQVRPELIAEIREKAKAAGLYAANMPEDLGGGGLDAVGVALMERELGRTSFALQYAVARPSNILRACKGEQIERYLLPAIRGERVECLAMTEPGAGSDLRSMKTRAVRDGEDYRPQRHQAFHQLCRCRRFRHPLRRLRRGGDEARRQEEDHLLPGGQGHPRLRGPHGAAQRLPSRLPSLRARLHGLPDP